MKILIFTEGTIIMHKNAVDLTREEIVQQVVSGEKSVKDYASYIPIGKAVEVIRGLVQGGNEIIYLTSRRKVEEVQTIQNILDLYDFPRGELDFRRDGESYANVAERIMPDVLVEDDCESIGGSLEMTYPNISPEKKARMRLVVVREFEGIDRLDFGELSQNKLNVY